MRGDALLHPQLRAHMPEDEGSQGRGVAEALCL